MNDPFRIAGPAVVSFSGGRTSAYMLWRILQAHGGALPDDLVVCFANTGKERIETLDFVQRCADAWSVPIAWLEWRDGPAGKRFSVVSHASASRAGEPFSALIRKRRFLPNQVSRFCTQELKIRVMKDWTRATLGWARWTNVVGLRADEPGRVAKATDPERASKERWRVACPLAEAGVSQADVRAFWASMPFDLGLSPHEGNCDLCYLKSRGKLARIIRDNPGISAWWEGEEAATGGTFRPPERRQSYRELRQETERQPELLPAHSIFDDRMECQWACTD